MSLSDIVVDRRNPDKHPGLTCRKPNGLRDICRIEEALPRRNLQIDHQRLSRTARPIECKRNWFTFRCKTFFKKHTRHDRQLLRRRRDHCGKHETEQHDDRQHQASAPT
ncbi:MAG: hypothetical protein ACR2O4_02730 [Hyphomicrobiaceae bacterium]